MAKKLEAPKFPYSMFPVCVRHKDGKEMKDTKTCYFQTEDHAKKYIARSQFKKKDYEIFVKPQK